MESPCPNCGYCPTCKRANPPDPWRSVPTAPVVPYQPTTAPPLPAGPIWIDPTYVPGLYPKITCAGSLVLDNAQLWDGTSLSGWSATVKGSTSS